MVSVLYQVKSTQFSKFPRPTTIKGLQEFQGMLSYYHRFIPHAAKILTPLYDKVAGKPNSLEWDTALEEAFQDTKTLAHPDPAAKIFLVTDASNVAIGAVLEQEVKGQRQPLAYFSRKLRPPERQYSTFDRELLAVHMAIRHFRHMLEGQPYTICTDHKPLVAALTKPNDAWTARQQRHLSVIAETGCTMQYLPGLENPVATPMEEATSATC